MALTRADLTLEQWLKLYEFSRQGYMVCTFADDGTMCPGYADWQIEYILDELELIHAFASLNAEDVLPSTAAESLY